MSRTRRPARGRTPAGAGSAAYVYCVLRAPRGPGLGRVPEGLPGTGRPRAVPLWDGTWVVLAEAPLAGYHRAAIEAGLRDLEWVSVRALAHERVVEHVSRLGPVVPLKLFTLFASERRAVLAMSRRRPTLERLLERLRGHREWGVRVSLDRQRAQEVARSRADRQGRALSAGTRFLVAKKAVLAESRAAVHRAAVEAERVFAQLRGLAREARRRPPLGKDGAARLVLDAAFLVPERHEPRFLAAAKRWAERLAGQGCSLVVTGPWPPYNFVALK